MVVTPEQLKLLVQSLSEREIDAVVALIAQLCAPPPRSASALRIELVAVLGQLPASEVAALLSAAQVLDGA